MLLNVLGDIDQYRSGAVELRQGKCLTHHRRDITNCVDQKILLGDGFGDGNYIRFLEGVFAHQVSRDVTGYGNDWNGITEGIAYARDQISGTRPRRGQTHTDFSCCPCISFGGMGCTLFMFGAYATNIIIPENIKNLQVSPARIPEQDFNAFVLQGLGEELSPPPCNGTIFLADVIQGSTRYGRYIAVGNIIRNCLFPFFIL